MGTKGDVWESFGERAAGGFGRPSVDWRGNCDGFVAIQEVAKVQNMAPKISRVKKNDIGDHHRNCEGTDASKVKDKFSADYVSSRNYKQAILIPKHIGNVRI